LTCWKRLERHNKTLTYIFLYFINILLWYIYFFFNKGGKQVITKQRMRKGRREKGTRESRENFVDLLLPLYSYLDHWNSIPVHNTPALLYGSSISSPDPSTYCWETALPLIKNSTDSKFLCQECNDIHTLISW